MIEKSFAAVKFAGIAAKQRKGYSPLKEFFSDANSQIL